MFEVFTVIHILVSVGIIFIVLLQSSKGSDFGGVFGVGGGSGFFGGRGAGGFLVKVTTVMAIIFMVTSFTLGVIPSIRKSSILETEIIEQPIEEKTQTQRQGLPSETSQDADSSQ